MLLGLPYGQVCWEEEENSGLFKDYGFEQSDLLDEKRLGVILVPFQCFRCVIKNIVDVLLLSKSYTVDVNEVEYVSRTNDLSFFWSLMFK